MPLDVKAYRVLIASPGDVAKERNIIREQIAQWNAMHTQDMRIVLLPIGWETDSTPSLEDRGQAIINRQLVDSCDLLIGVFWTRIGTPTSEAESGTVEEIERAHNQGIHCIIYFSDQGTKPSQIDQKQYQSLQAYRKDLQGKGLTDGYSELEEFKGKVFRHITSAVSKITREDKERRAAEQEAKLTEQAIGLSVQGGSVHRDTFINVGSTSITDTVLTFATFAEAQKSLKTLLESRFGFQEVEDIKEREIARIQAVMESPDFVEHFSKPPTVETVPVIAKIIETATTPSMYLLASIGRYADDTSLDWKDISGNWIERLSTRQHTGGYVWASHIMTYPGLLLLYSLGISALRSGKLDFLKEVLSRSVYSQEYSEEYPLLDNINPWHVFYNNVSKVIEPGFENKHTPVNDHLDILLKEKLYSSEEEVRHRNWFDLFEFLLSLKARQQDADPYFGTFAWRSSTRRFLRQMIQDAAVRKGRYGPAIQDLFGGISKFEETAREYDQMASKSGRDFGRVGLPRNIESLIQSAKADV
jgi:Domain of unknown function (DUF4062)